MVCLPFIVHRAQHIEFISHREAIATDRDCDFDVEKKTTIEWEAHNTPYSRSV